MRGADGELLYDEGGAMRTEVRDFRPYFLLDARLSWQREWGKRSLQLYLDATNATDTRYLDFGGMPMPGVWIGAGVVVTL